MAEQTGPGANWYQAWAEAQQRLWQGWLALAQPAAAAGSSAGGTAGRDAAAQWLRLWQSPAGSAWLPAADMPQGEIMRGLAAFWGLPMDMWQRLTSALSALPGDAFQGSKAWDVSHAGAAGRAGLEHFLSIPPFGYTREWQEQGQQATRDWLAYQDALGAYLGIMTRIATRTAEVVAQRFAARGADGKPITGLREAYDLFVDCAEDAYAEVVTAGDFGKVSARLMNAAVAVKRHAQAVTEEMANAANLPTRRELDTSHRQAQILRRQLAALQEELRALRAAPAAPPGTEIDALRNELAALRAEVALLRGSGKGDADKPAVRPVRAVKLANPEG